MGILTGRDEAMRVVAIADYAFIGTLTDYAKGLYLKGINIKYIYIIIHIGMSTRALPPTDTYTLEFDKLDQLYGLPIQNEEPHFHYLQTGSGGQIVDPKTHKLVPAPEPKRPKIGQLYLALLDSPQQIKQLVEIKEDDIDALRKVASEHKSR
jgi:hypothetical protein